MFPQPSDQEIALLEYVFEKWQESVPWYNSEVTIAVPLHNALRLQQPAETETQLAPSGVLYVACSQQETTPSLLSPFNSRTNDVRQKTLGTLLYVARLPSVERCLTSCIAE